MAVHRGGCSRKRLSGVGDRDPRRASTEILRRRSLRDYRNSTPLNRLRNETVSVHSLTANGNEHRATLNLAGVVGDIERSRIEPPGGSLRFDLVGK
jgi:hypothetical protein